MSQEFHGIPEFLRPRLRLFMSVDLVGSTALKQAGDFPISKPAGDEPLDQSGPQWVLNLAGFYRDIDAKFRFFCRNYSENEAGEYNWPTTISARLWKVNGDELIYVWELSSAREAVALLSCWLRACCEFRKDLKSKKQKLDVKMSAWTAGFPISNTEVIFPRIQKDKYDDWYPVHLHYHFLEKFYGPDGGEQHFVQDFIGPSIDTGFRLSAKATPRKFIISVELAYLISLTSIPSKLEIKLGYDGQEALKGVFGGKPYPIFWIDTHSEDKLSNAEDSLSGSPHKEATYVRRFCEYFFDDVDAYVLKPFIWGDTEPLATKIPAYYIEKIKHLYRKCQEADETKRIEFESLSSDNAPPLLPDSSLPTDISIDVSPSRED